MLVEKKIIVWSQLFKMHTCKLQQKNLHFEQIPNRPREDEVTSAAEWESDKLAVQQLRQTAKCNPMIPLQIDAIQKSTCLSSRQRTEYEHIGWTCNVTKLTHPQGQNTLNEEPVTNPKQKIILVCSCKLERPYTRKTGNHWRARNCPPLPEYQKPNCTRRRLYQPLQKNLKT